MLSHARYDDSRFNPVSNPDNLCIDPQCTEFTELLDPLKPLEPIESIESIEPIEPIELMDFLEPVRSLDSMDSVGPPDPSLLMDPAIPASLLQSTDSWPQLPEHSTDLVLHSISPNSPFVVFDDSSEDHTDVELGIEPRPHQRTSPDNELLTSNSTIDHLQKALFVPQDSIYKSAILSDEVSYTNDSFARYDNQLSDNLPFIQV